MKKYSFTVISLFLFFVLVGTRQVAADEVTKWNETATRVAFESGLSSGNPTFESRLYAITHAAIHDALNAIDRRSQPYALDLPFTLDASPEAAVATAAHRVLVDQFNRLIAFGFPTQQATLDAAYADSLALIPDSAAKTRGILIGRIAAAVILAIRVDDGWDSQPVEDFNYPQGTAPGEYKFTPPFNFAASTNWGRVTPFVLRHAAQFRPGPPYAVTSRRYADDLNEIKRLGGDGVTTPSERTLEQTEIALFWVESSPIQWNRIARTVSAAKGLTMWENARLFGLLNLALADGYIGSLETKYHYNYWRPITAIREADTDGNPLTSADPTWTPLVVTPPVPDYDSGHSVAGGAGAQVLMRFFGTDAVSFTTCSTTLPAGGRCNDPSAVTRSYTSFTEAAEENGLSRILVGYHFRKAVTEGIEHGRKIGNRAVNRFLRPVH
jgi:PAP2 superfamily